MTSTVLEFFQTQGYIEFMYFETLYLIYDIGSLYWDNKEIEEQEGSNSK